MKLSEGIAVALSGMIQQENQASWLDTVAAFGVLPALRRVRRRLDYSEYGGVPLLGVNGVCVVAHGRSNALAIKSAVRVAARSTQQDVVGRIALGLPAAHLASRSPHDPNREPA